MAYGVIIDIQTNWIQIIIDQKFITLSIYNFDVIFLCMAQMIS
jgi:hypothetical protein